GSQSLTLFQRPGLGHNPARVQQGDMRVSETSFDVVIVGGGVIGSAAAYFLAASPDFDGRVAVVEKDPSYQTGATGRSAGSIRQQFSTPENVAISRFGA